MRLRQQHGGLLLGLLALIQTCNAYQGVSVATQHKMMQAIERDTAADPFTLLSPEERRHWATDVGMTINQTLQQFISIPVKPIIEVKLVGFDGGGRGHAAAVRLSDVELYRHLHALRADMDTVVLQPLLNDLPVRPEFSWMVNHDTTGLAGRLSSAIKQAVDQSTTGAEKPPYFGIPHSVSYKIVEDIIARDATRPSGAALTIYLLNLQPNVGKYGYHYKQTGEGMIDVCVGTHYASSAGGPRPPYVWVDISAGPVNYGPGPRQRGHVYEHSLPHPGNHKEEIVAAALAPQLAATVWSATQHLAWPPLQHLSFTYKPKVSVQVIHIHEGLTHAGDKFSHVTLEESLRAALGSNQAVKVHETWVPLSSCPLCVEAFTSSTRMLRARDDISAVITVTDSKVLDPAVMHALMARYKDSVYGIAGVSFDAADEQHTRILPVFIWEVADRDVPLLFMGGQPAVAFPDMVLAVASHVTKHYTPALCAFHQIEADMTDPTRAVLGALLTTGWGIVNISTTYTPATGPESNHMWALTNTPFGYLSTSTQLSGALAQLMPRNLALVHLQNSTTRLIPLLSGFARLSKHGKFDKSACGDFKDRIQTRVNLALFKLHQAQAAMTGADYWRAAQYARSLVHEVIHLERLVLRISQKVGSKLHCQAGGPTLITVWWAPFAAIALWPIASFLRGKLFPKKLDKLY